MYKEELVSKPALLVVNKMDLPDAEDKLAELKEQLQNPYGKFEGFFFFFYYSLAFIIFKFVRNYDVNKIMYLNTISILTQKSAFKQKLTQFNYSSCSTINAIKL